MRVLVVREARLSRRVWLRVQWCLMVVGRQQRQVQRLLRLLDLEVAVSTMHRQRLGKRLVQRWWLMGARCLMLRVQRHRRRRVRALLWMMLQRSQARRQELLWCIRVVVSARLWLQLRMRRRLLVDRRMLRLLLVRLRRLEPTHDTEASTRV